MTTMQVLKKMEEYAKVYTLPIIGQEKGKILKEIIIKNNPKEILEIGTLIGYSTLFMSQYLQPEGRITTIEIDPYVANTARDYFEMAGASHKINQVLGDAMDVIQSLNRKFDLLFIDAVKEDYLTYIKLAEDKLNGGAIVIADNVKIFESEMEDYLDYVRNEGRYSSITFDVGYDALEVSINNLLSFS